MFHATMAAAIDCARTLAHADELARTIWQAHANATVDDEEAQRLAEHLHERRKVIRGEVRPVGIPAGRASLFLPKRIQRSPDRIASRERRRRLAYSGPLPPALAARFTPAQLAVLRIVGDAVAASGVCALCLDAIAARAGVCRRTAQAAIRLAEGDGLLIIQERRRSGRTNDTNLVRVISREWQTWLRHARRSTVPTAVATQAVPIGCKVNRPTDKGLFLKEKRQAKASQESARRQGSPRVIPMPESHEPETSRAETVRRAMAGLFGRA